MYMNLLTFLGLKNPVLNFLNFSAVDYYFSYKPLSYKYNMYYDCLFCYDDDNKMITKLIIIYS